VQGEGYLPPLERSGTGTERAAEGRSAQAQRGRLGTLLARARDGVHQEGLVTLLCAERREMLSLLFLGWALRAGKARFHERAARCQDLRVADPLPCAL
jgi:hypothetical protein